MPLGANKAAIMGVAGVSTADVVLLAQNSDVTDVASIEFTSGITSTYGEYIFRFYNMNPESSGVNWEFQCSIDGGSNYNVTITTTAIKAYHHENDSASSVDYAGGGADLAQATTYQTLLNSLGTLADNSGAGELHLFNPASTTYVKHFYSCGTGYQDSPTVINTRAAGYFNTTSAINAISFRFSSGNTNGLVKMWGVK